MKPKVRKVKSDEEDSDFECYNESNGKPVHIDIDKELAEGNKPILTLLLNKSEEDEVNGETKDGDGKISLRTSNRIFKSPKRLDCVPYF